MPVPKNFELSAGGIFTRKKVFMNFFFSIKKGGKKRKRFISHNSLVTKNFQFQIIGSTFI